MITEKYTITGMVQGIGFRPSVKRIAEKYGIKGSVKNVGGEVCITACGGARELDRFKEGIKGIPFANITGFSAEKAKNADYSGFEILESGSESVFLPLITPDIAACDRCMEEFYNPKNRRYMHPFISCTDCGPRYSVIKDIPYDRCNIAMSDFQMCPECESEYRNIKNIRCHAQTIACNSCGPKLSYTVEGNPLDEAVKTINSGGVAAVKDIGGYHFACSAFNESAAAMIRKIKKRETKPFAVMFNSALEAERYVKMSDMERDALMSFARPIVLLEKKRELAYSVCGESDYIGAFLPCNPVQHYLTRYCGALVMTSANVSGEPIIADNDTMFKLKREIGGFEILSHDRRILNPSDDSVCHVICGKLQMIRRARGYVPLPVSIKSKRDIAVLASGSDLKASFCYAKGNTAYMSRYFGDLENAGVYNEWKTEIKSMGRLLRIGETEFISDMHPLYFSANYRTGIKLQHHFAHMASVMAEHRLNESALGFIFDGTGYGEDECIWGGEVIEYKNGFRRAASLEYTKLIGGDHSAKSAKQTLDCFLISAGLEPKSENASLIKTALKNNINTVKSSSMGRLFDAVSALLGICEYNSYEGECAILLESAAKRAREAYPLKLYLKDGKWLSSRLIQDIYEAYSSGADSKSLALGFHKAVGEAVCDYARGQKEKNIILSGGVFSNRILSEICFYTLKDEGYNVYINEQVPCNDQGIALGQAWGLLNM